MKYFVYITIIIYVFQCLSCTTISEQPGLKNNTIVASFANTDEYVPKIEESYIPDNYGEYTYYFETADNLIGVSSSKPGPLNDAMIYHYAGSPNTHHITKAMDNKLLVKINGMDINTFAKTKSTVGMESLFGTDVQITVLSPQYESDSITTDLYFPEQIEITSPYIDSEEKLLPLCYYDGFQLRWNKDENNDNGVIAIIDWIGETVLGKDVQNTHVRRVCKFKDTGVGVFNSSIFDGIPDTAVCHLILLRGDIEMDSLNNESFKIMAETHEFMSFVLIRYITDRT